MRTLVLPEIHPTTPGPWADEPDKAQWVDEATGLDCLALRGPGGAWCGYAGVPPGHPWYGVDRYDRRLRVTTVHGDSVNYSAFCDEDSGDAAICHVPEPGREPRVWWLGFHCATGYDIEPVRDAELERIIGRLPARMCEGATYKPLEYVVAETESLARQARSAALHRLFDLSADRWSAGIAAVCACGGYRSRRTGAGAALRAWRDHRDMMRRRTR